MHEFSNVLIWKYATVKIDLIYYCYMIFVITFCRNLLHVNVYILFVFIYIYLYQWNLISPKSQSWNTITSLSTLKTFHQHCVECMLYFYSQYYNLFSILPYFILQKTFILFCCVLKCWITMLCQIKHFLVMFDVCIIILILMLNPWFAFLRTTSSYDAYCDTATPMKCLLAINT